MVLGWAGIIGIESVNEPAPEQYRTPVYDAAGVVSATGRRSGNMGLRPSRGDR